MENFSLSEIEKVWINEKTEKELCGVSEDFYEKSADYASEIRKEIKKSENLRKELLTEELKHILEMVQEIYLIRILKISGTLFKVEKSKLLEKERETFEKIRKELKNLKEELIKPITETEIDLKTPEKTSTTIVCIKSEIPEPIVASDMKYYGPFEKNEIANLPNESAKLLINQGLAREVKIKKE
ncbi:hypothetical protein AKJ50_02105 [candidate division MSBL1 archaeon SCGC-AAA382A13]|uniref:Gins51 C-terminal domain-containing protein n=1 Tax=candidate division MSBL1 archaeon SCGC-AAA382A13 TaxID=1698279 RepID=A0A133VE28_9EURY|nr:hypothetical protein AKJ50_02105 [candidate division MSBL1 archaeon SCGC-AAA382A13]